jgi:predicted permease
MTRKQMNVVLKIFFAPLMVFSVHALAIAYLDVYSYWHNFDIPMHFFGGASIAFALYLTVAELQKKKVLTVRSAILLALIVISGTVTTAVLWEFHEFLLDFFLHTHIQVDNADTMKDLFMGTLGSIATALLRPLWERHT